MSTKLTTSIKSDNIYNIGGIFGIWLLNIDDFERYKFADDSLYDTGFVTDIIRKGEFIELGEENETQLIESFADGVYKQELKTYLREINGNVIRWILQAQNCRFLVVAVSRQGQALVFGADGGARVSYSGQSGQKGDVNGASIKVEKTSFYPMLEVDPDTLKTKLLSSEAFQYICTEDKQNLIKTHE